LFEIQKDTKAKEASEPDAKSRSSCHPLPIDFRPFYFSLFIPSTEPEPHPMLQTYSFLTSPGMKSKTWLAKVKVFRDLV
jgi:hypothetical protein